MKSTWQAVNPASLLWVAWEDHQAAYHGETGETHLLGELPSLLVQILTEQAMDADALSRLSAAHCDVSADAAWNAKVHKLLEDLAHLELIERCS
jgi:PqqD family protein of HPr-rel-A system